METNIKETTLKAINEIKNGLPQAKYVENEPMSRHTSFRIGGPAAMLVYAANENELAEILGIVSACGAEHMLVGNGSNLLVADEGYPGIAIKLTGDFEEAVQDKENETLVTAGAARLTSSLSAFLTERGLSGFEFASGIPGSLGGAVFMNAGAYGGEIKDIAVSARLMSADGSEVRTASADEMDFSYRHSRAQETGDIVLSVTFRLEKDSSENIAARVSELMARRNSKQPVNFPSAGSTFKRPVGGYAAALIEESGLKGYRVGGAVVSEKHSGFVINDGGATAADVLAVMRHVRDTVYADSGILLEPEVRLINCSL